MTKIWHELKLGNIFFFHNQCIFYNLNKAGESQQDGLTAQDKLRIREASPLMRTHSRHLRSTPWTIFLHEIQYVFGDVKHVCEFLSITQVGNQDATAWRIEILYLGKPRSHINLTLVRIQNAFSSLHRSLSTKALLFYLSVKTTVGLRSMWKFGEQRPVLFTSKGC